MKKIYFTAKHFIKIASVLNNIHSRKLTGEQVIDEIIEVLIVVFSDCNPRFKPDVFRNAIKNEVPNEAANS